MNPVERAAREAAHERHVFATVVTVASLVLSVFLFAGGQASGPSADFALRLALAR